MQTHHRNEGFSMRHAKIVAPLFLAAAFVSSCQSTAAKSTAETKQQETAALQLGKAKAATAEAARAMEDYAYTQKTEFVTEMNKGLVATQEELDRIAGKVENSTSAAKADAKAKLQVARDKWTQTKQQLNQVQNATESTWNDMKKSFKDSYTVLKSSVDETRQWLSDKIAP
jgi:small-conductance mechanosensitive channel